MHLFLQRCLNFNVVSFIKVFIYGLCFCILFLISFIQIFRRFFLLNIKVLHLTSRTLTYLELLSCERWTFNLAFFLLYKPSVLEPNSKWFFPHPLHWCVMAPLSYTRFITRTPHMHMQTDTHGHVFELSILFY